MSKLRRSRGARAVRASVLVIALVAPLTSCAATNTASPANAAAGGGPGTTGHGSPASPPATYPLTGMPTDGQASDRPALSVKVDNIENALPQSGLNDADIVFEALVEGGQTRLFVTYHSHGAAAVGPIRSARPVDADLLTALGGGLFAYSGAAPGEIAPVEEYSGATLLSNDAGVSAFYRERGKRAPHNVYAATPDLYAAGVEAGDHSPRPPALFHFGAVNGGTPVANADVPMGNYADAAWHWNAQDGTYERHQNGKADVLEDGSVVSATNVLLMSVAIAGTGVFDVNRVEDPLPVVIGFGPCWLMRDGVLIEGSWSRADTHAPTIFRDNSGNEMLFQPGRTWVELVPNSLQPSFG